MIITIDGPAGSGKSTAAKLLASKLGFIHFNSGSLFRAITAYLDDTNFQIESITQNSIFPKINLETKIINNLQHVFVNKKDYTPVLRDNKISNLVPLVAANKSCRFMVDNCQRSFASNHNIVVEGRDTGSHVFPQAEFKFYLDCSIEERAKRRFLEEQIKNPSITINEIAEQIKERDLMDKTREFAPLTIPKDAIIIDSTTLSVDQVVEKMLIYIKQ